MFLSAQELDEAAAAYGQEPCTLPNNEALHGSSWPPNSLSSPIQILFLFAILLRR